MNTGVTNGIDTIISAGAANNFLFYFQNQSTLTFQNPGASVGIPYSISVGVPFLFTVTGNATNQEMRFYKNGQYVINLPNINYTTPTSAGSLGIVLGQEYDSNATGGFDSTQK